MVSIGQYICLHMLILGVPLGQILKKKKIISQMSMGFFWGKNHKFLK